MRSAVKTSSVRRFVPVVAPVVIGVVFGLLGHPLQSTVLWVLAGVTLLLVLAGVPVERYLARFGAWAAHAVGLVATWSVGLLLVVAGGVLRVLRRDPLTPRRARGNGWQPAGAAAESDRLAAATFGLERGGSVARPSLGRSALMAIGAVTALLAVDLGVGLAWERLSDAETPVTGVVDAINFTGDTDTVYDPRADVAAMEAYPWAEAYFREIQQTPSSYWPFTESRPLRFEGEYVNIEGWSRRSYVPDDLPDDAPVVWMFGGSTTWGEGQRDEYTIASYLARIAEEEGVPIRVRNFGQRGWTHFQEMILFEQLLASEPPPDLAIFYDGANEINAQTLSAKGVPTHVLVDQYAELISAGIAEELSVGDDGPIEPSGLRQAWDAYAGHSAIQKLARRARNLVDPPAGASTAAPAGIVRQRDDEGGIHTNYEKDEADAERAVDVYQRGRRLTSALAEHHEVPVVFFWQPVIVGPAEQRASELLTPPTIDISDLLEDHPEVFIDGGHTNEEGARIVAEGLWVELGDRVEAASGRERRERSSPTTTVPSSADQLAEARVALNAVVDDPCALGTWSTWLSQLSADDPTQVDQVVALVQRFLGELIQTAEPATTESIAGVQALVGVLPEQARAVRPLYGEPLLPQLPLAEDPAFGVAVQELLSVLDGSPACS